MNNFDLFKKEQKQYFDIEKASIEYFNDYYNRMGLKVIQRLKGRENKKRDVDLKHIETDLIYKVEEKSDSYFYPACPIELIQNLPNPETENLSLGNLYTTKAKIIMHFYFQNQDPYRMYKWYPREIYRNLYLLLKEFKDQLTVTHKGWGITLVFKLPWDYMIEKKYAELIRQYE